MAQYVLPWQVCRSVHTHRHVIYFWLGLEYSLIQMLPTALRVRTTICAIVDGDAVGKMCYRRHWSRFADVTSRFSGHPHDLNLRSYPSLRRSGSGNGALSVPRGPRRRKSRTASCVVIKPFSAAVPLQPDDPFTTTIVVPMKKRLSRIQNESTTRCSNEKGKCSFLLQ